MTQTERDRLVTLKKARDKVISQGEAALEIGVSVRQVQRMLEGLKERGDEAVVHRLRGRPSKRRIGEKTEKEAVKILSAPVYEGFGPTLAAEYLEDKHGTAASKETVRQWMIRGQLWKAKKEKVKQVPNLASIGRLDLIRSQFSEVRIPSAVAQELATHPNPTAIAALDSALVDTNRAAPGHPAV